MEYIKSLLEILIFSLYNNCYSNNIRTLEWTLDISVQHNQVTCDQFFTYTGRS